MRRGTTPTLTIGVKGIYISEFADVVITLKQGKTIVNKEPVVEHDDEKHEDVFKVELTQEETLAFNSDLKVAIQMKAMLMNGKVIASEIENVYFKEILNEEVMV